MKAYTTTNWKMKLALGAATIAVSAALLEWVTDGFVHPSPDAVAARRAVIAAQADQVEKGRALVNGEVKSAQAARAPGF